MHFFGFFATKKKEIATQPARPMQTVTSQEAMDLITKIGPSLGYDHTYEPVFPEGRADVCAVRRLAENGSTYGFDTIYLVWKAPDGSLQFEEIANSRESKDYIHIKKVEVMGNGLVSVDFGSGGSYSGAPWSDTAISDRRSYYYSKFVISGS